MHYVIIALQKAYFSWPARPLESGVKVSLYLESRSGEWFTSESVSELALEVRARPWTPVDSPAELQVLPGCFACAA